MAQVRIKNLTQHRIYVPVPVGIMMRPAQEVILSEVSDDLLAQSKKISRLVQQHVIQVSIQPQDPDIDDTLETRFINTGGGVPMHGPTHHDGGVDPVDIDQLRATGAPVGYILEAGAGGSLNWVSHAAPPHAASHADGAADEVDVGTLGSTTAPGPGYLPAADGAGGLAWTTPTAPGAHNSTHQHGGVDEVATATPAANAIPKAGGSGQLAAGWIPAATPLPHASTHDAGGADPMAIDAAAGTGSLRTLGTGAQQACAGDDARLSDARTPTSHAASHQHGGTDEVATATPAANAIPKADGTGQLAAGWIPVAGSLATLTKEPTGFPNRTDSNISFVPSPNRRFTIQPAVTSFDVYINGVQFTKSAAETIDLTDTTGLWYIYYDATGTLQASLTPWGFNEDKAFVAIIYWNSAAATQSLWGEERHGLVMDWSTHAYLHYAFGARYVSGFPASGFVLDSDTDADVTFGLGNGAFEDEDILMSIQHAATPSNPFEQVLTDPAEIPVVYRDGAGGNWLKDTATTFPFKNTVAGRINYNQDVAGTWQQTQVANNNFVAYWIFATNDPDEPIISVQGQREDNTLVLARANNGFDTLNFGSLPSPEWVLLYRAIYQTGSGFGGTRKAKLEALDDFRTADLQPGEASSATAHSSLTGLAVGNDHPQYQLRSERAIHMATSGGDVQTMAAAITEATALTPSASAPVAILVHPGVYSTPPFSLPNYVSIVGVAGFGSAVLSASTATSAFCTANGGSRIEGLTLRDASGVGGVGIDVGGAAGDLLVKDCYVDDCETAIRCVGTGYSVVVEHTTVEDGVTGMLVDGIAARGRVNQLAMIDFTTGLHVGSTGGIVTGTGLRVMDDTGFTTHVRVENAGSVLALIDSTFRADKTDYNTSAEIAVMHASIVPGDESMQFTSEVHVGTQDRPRESCFGGGDSNTRSLGVLTNTNLEAGTWADITTNLKFQDATSATLLAGTGVGNCCYIGADFKFPGIKTLTTTAMVLGTGSVIMEYWNGTAWTAFRHMTTAGNAPYTQYAQDLLTRAASEQVRFDTDILATWATKTLNTVTKYWVRLRVVTAITTAPASDIIKNHTHRTEINADGIIEFFGNAEPHRDLVWDITNEGRQDGFDPKDAVSEVASGVDWKNRDNDFEDGVYLGKLSGIRVAQGWDTSRELTYVFGWHPRNGATLTGDVEIEIAGYHVKPGDQFDGTKTADFTASQIIDVSTLSAAEVVLTEFNFSLEDFVPGDLLILHIIRDASPANLDDTFADDVYQFLAALQGVVWKT